MNAKSVNANKPLTPQQQAMRRAFAASKRIPNAPAKDRAKRVHAWAEFVKQVSDRIWELTSMKGEA